MCQTLHVHSNQVKKNRTYTFFQMNWGNFYQVKPDAIRRIICSCISLSSLFWTVLKGADRLVLAILDTLATHIDELGMFFLRHFFFRCLYSFFLSTIHFSKFIYRCYGMHFEPSMLSHLVHFFFRSSRCYFCLFIPPIVCIAAHNALYISNAMHKCTNGYWFNEPFKSYIYIYIHYTHM